MTNFRIFKTFLYFLTALIALMFLPSCTPDRSGTENNPDAAETSGPPGKPQDPAATADGAASLNLQAALEQFPDCKAVEAELKDLKVKELESRKVSAVDHEIRREEWKSRPRNDGMIAENSVEPTASIETASDTAGGGQTGAPGDYTGTNNQVEGVQEADFIKNNGTHIYQIVRNSVRVIKIWPANEMKTVATIDLSMRPSSLLLDENKLIVIGGDTQDHRKTLIQVYDISDPAGPLESLKYSIDGFLHDGSIRRNGTLISLVTTDSLVWDYESEDFFDYSRNFREMPLDERITAIEKYYDGLIEKTGLQSLATVVDGITRDDCKKVFAPEGDYRPAVSRIVSLNLADGSAEETILLTQATHFYHSGTSLYIASAHHWWDSPAQNSDYTFIHKFSAPDGTSLQYKGSGTVGGTLLNQFSMDEHEDVLRLAATVTSWSQEDGRWWRGADTYNHVLTMKEEEGSLKILGKTPDLAPGERIFSARFNGPKGYVVTFRQVDPLFTLDLSDPEHPEVVGELKIPGYSSYMHMLDDSHILTVGRDGTDEGRITGLKISLFDVSDPADPVESHKHVVEGHFWSQAEWDHKAFTFFKSRGLLAIPVSGYNPDPVDGQWWSRYQSKLMIFKVTAEDGIADEGSLDMTDVYQKDALPWNYWSYSARVSRSIFADDFVYGISQLGIRVANISGLENPVATESFPCTECLNVAPPWMFR